VSHSIGFGLKHTVLDDRNACTERVRNTAGTLLDHVLQLVAEKKLPTLGVGVILTRSKVNLRAPGES
jgi:hypothetical protein